MISTIILQAIVLCGAIQITPTGSTINYGALILKNNEVLEINTTAPSINCSPSCNYHLSHENRSSSGDIYPVAVIIFTGDIALNSGSTVKVVGEYALSIRSLNGSIYFQTDINMTCGERWLNTTCLGGFTQLSAGESAGPPGSQTPVYRGLGPGGLIIPSISGPVSRVCLSGSSHGGKGHQGTVFKARPPYGNENMTSLLGGSGGSCLERPGSVAGGGAIELVAEEGDILISTTIRASAQMPTSHLRFCSGASGGLIRLRAKKVEIRETGKLIVDGGSALQPGVKYRLGGGGGGIIQIIAPRGSLAIDTLSLRHGDNSRACDTTATNGHFLLKVNGTASPMFNGSTAEWPPSFYSWPQTSNNSGAIVSTSSSASPAERKPNLIAIIYGGTEVTRGQNENITMNASLSYDPIVGLGNYSRMNFTWHYGEIKGNYSGLQTAARDSFAGINLSNVHYVGNDCGREVIFNTASSMFQNLTTLVVKLVMAKDNRSSSDHQVIHLVKGDPPQISQRCIVNCEPKISPSVKLSIQSQCYGPQCSNISSYQWILYKQYPSATNNGTVWRRIRDLQLITTTPLNSSSIVIKEGSLAGGKNYQLAVFVLTMEDQQGMSAHDISTASPPTMGTCSITPSDGISLMTFYNLSCSHWESDSKPLSYRFQYQLQNGLHGLLYDGSNSSVIYRLPSGNFSCNYTVRVIVIVTDRNGVSAPTINLSVQVEPYPELLRPEHINTFVTANNSEFNNAITDGDLSKAERIANEVLQAVLKDTTTDSTKTSKIQDFIIEKIASLQVKSLPDLLQISSIIGSAIQQTETVSVTSLGSSLSAIESMTSFLWNTTQAKDVAKIPLVTQSTENLVSCLNSLLKAGSVIASADLGSDLQEKGKHLVKRSMDIINVVGDAVMALSVPEEEMTSIETTGLTMTLGRHSPDKLVGLNIEEKDAGFDLPAEKSVLESSRIQRASFVDTQMLLIPFNPYTWDSTKQRVNSDVLALDLKDNTRKLIKVSNLSNNVIVVTPLKPQTVSLESPQYFTQNDNLRFHKIDVEYENTLIMLEITPTEANTNLLVYLRYDQRPTTQEHDLNATVSKSEKCVWTPGAHGRKDGKTKCSRLTRSIETLAKRPGKYFLGVQGYNRSGANSHKREKTSCFGSRRQKRSCVEVKDPPPTPPQSENVTVVPVYNSKSVQNYTLRVALGSCVFWSEEREKWITEGCRVLSATLNGSIKCSCNHLTSFGGALLIKPNPINFDKVTVEFKSLQETGNVAVIVTISVVLLCFIVVQVIVRKADKKDARNTALPVHLPSTESSSHVYQIIISTGVWRNSGTTAKVAMEIYGSEGSSGIVQLNLDEPDLDHFLFTRGNTDVFVLNLSQSLGAIQAVQIGHDNSGQSPSWFLEEIIVIDEQVNQSWAFTSSQWLALEREDGRIERIIEQAPNEGTFIHEVIKRWWRGLTETHLWVSVLAKPRRSRFTRVQRASCCLSVLLTAMFANAMFYKLDGKSRQILQVGPLKFSWHQIIIAIKSTLFVAPINMATVFLFQKGARETPSCLKAKCLKYLAWFFLFGSCGVSASFTIFYSLIWGKSTSEQWLSSVLLSLGQDVSITETAKVLFMAIVLAAILRWKKSRSEGRQSHEAAKSSPSQQRLWKMKLSEVEDMRKQQLKKKNLSLLLFELVVYVLFIFLVMVLCYGNRNSYQYHMTKSIQDGLPNFDKVNDNQKLWSWLNDAFIPGVFAGRWYNGKQENQTVYIGNKHSVLVGMARVRQLRVKPTSCKVDYMTRMFPVCYDGYGVENEDKTRYSKPAWKPTDSSSSHEELLRLCPKPWRYQNPGESDTVPKWGQFSFYPGGGFVADLGYENTTGFSIIENLKSNDWLDRQTRAAIVEFSVFNPSVNVLGIATYFYEVGASGYTETFKRIDVLSLHSTQTAAKQFYMICVLLFIVFVLLYLGRECYKLCKRGFRYFKSFWNWLEFFQVFFSVLAVITHIVQAKKVTSDIRKLRENLYGNVSFQEALVWREVDNVILGVLMFVVSVKLLRLIRFNKHVAVFSTTLKKGARHLASFSVILFTLFVAFLHFGILIFGAGFERYSSVLKATVFQLELTLGRVKARPINELALTNEMFGRIFAAMILLSITILVMNFFIVILNDALAEAKNTAKESPLYDPNGDECSWKKTNERHQFYDQISECLRQRKLEETLARSQRKTEEEVDSRKNTMINFDVISLQIKASRKQKIEASENAKQNNPAKKSFFDLVNNSIVYLKHARNEHRCYLNNKEKKVRFAEDVTKSQLRRLQATKKDLFQRLDSIVQEYSREAEQEEKFELILDEMGVHNSRDPIVNVTATANESFD